MTYINEKLLSTEKTNRLKELGYNKGLCGIDCHDLLIELAKQDKKDLDFTLFTVVDTDGNVSFVYGHNWLAIDPIPVEALGEALIKILEAEGKC